MFLVDFAVKNRPIPHSVKQSMTDLLRQQPIARNSSEKLSALVIALLLCAGATFAQGEKPKIPGLDKIISANQHLMFTGKVKQLDERRNTLSVSSVEGSDTEIFPIKSNTRVLTSDGFRKKLDVLKPGVQVIVYYDQRSDRRSITRIDLFTSETKKKEPSS